MADDLSRLIRHEVEVIRDKLQPAAMDLALLGAGGGTGYAALVSQSAAAADLLHGGTLAGACHSGPLRDSPGRSSSRSLQPPRASASRTSGGSTWSPAAVWHRWASRRSRSGAGRG